MHKFYEDLYCVAFSCAIKRGVLSPVRGYFLFLSAFCFASIFSIVLLPIRFLIVLNQHAHASHTRCSDFWTGYEKKKKNDLKEKWEWRGFGVFIICIRPIAISKWSTSMPSSQCHGHKCTYVTFASNTRTCNTESHTVINTNGQKKIEDTLYSAHIIE